jgi:FkbM family methyltransferase
MPDQIVEITSRAGSANVIVKNELEFIQRVWLKKHRFYENRLLEYIYWHYKGRVFVDVGSYLGNHTLFFAAFCEPKHVISVEPDPNSIQHQKENLSLNNLHRRITYHECAISNREGRASLKSWDERYGAATNRLVPGDDVAVTTLDTLLADVKHINFIKIDVEQHELEALQGAEETLSRERPCLFVEYKRKPTYHKCVDLLNRHNYIQTGTVFQDASIIEYVPRP